MLNSEAVAAASDEAVVCLIQPPVRGAVLPMFAEYAGDEQALIAYELLLSAANKLLNTLPTAIATSACSAIALDATEFRRYFSTRVEFVRAPGEDFVQRLRAVSESMFAQGVARLAFVVAECPRLTKLHLIQTFLALRSVELVLGPASNGGLFLLGLSAPLPEWFDGLHWESRFLMDDLRDLLRGRGLGWTEIAPLPIIETQADWDDFQRGQPG
jgi:glycosyltransferase A (GT-A) superfamily protein (DUF2064 family)